MPSALIDALIAQGARDLTIVSNNAGNGDTGLAALLKAEARAQDHLLLPAPGRLVVSTRSTARARSSSNWCRRATSPSASAPPAPASARSSRPRATARCSRDGKETRAIDGRDYVLEYPIHADVALIRALKRRPLGQPRLPQDRAQLRPDHGHGRAAARSPRCDEIVELGALDPEAVVTPGIFVQRVVGRRADAAAAQPARPEGARPCNADARPDGRARRRATSRRRLREPRHRPADAGRQPPAAGPRDHPAHRERPARHGPGAAPRATRTADLINAGKQPVTALPGACLLPPRRLASP